jgi:hypothetical protein
MNKSTLKLKNNVELAILEFCLLNFLREKQIIEILENSFNLIHRFIPRMEQELQFSFIYI